MPEVAGLRFILPQLVNLPDHLTNPRQLEKWKRILGILPELPLRDTPLEVISSGGRKFDFKAVDNLPALAPAEQFSDKWNAENPELYAIFPYRLIGLGKPDIELGRRAMQNRIGHYRFGWCQVDIQLALLGMAKEARSEVFLRAQRKYEKSRFPAMWTAVDGVPDQCHGSVLVKAVQSMLMQCEGERILLSPAWPKDWNTRFKLHAPFNTTIEGRISDGQVEVVKVVPESRRKDIVIMDLQ
jgi:hypothetical protein